MNNNDKVVAKIKEIRTTKNIRQKAVADALKIKETTYGRIENGYTELTINNLFIICNCLKISLIEVLEIDTTNPINNNQNLVMNNVNKGTLNINLTAEEFNKLYTKIQEEELGRI